MSDTKLRVLKFALLAGMPVMFGAVYYVNQGRDETGPLKLSYCKESIELLKGYRPAMEKLGSPLKLGKIDDKDPFNITGTDSIQVKIPITGQKRSADLLAYAHKADEDRNWKIDKLEIQYKGSKNRFKFFDRSLINKQITQSESNQ